MAAKLTGLMEILEEKGTELRLSYSGPLGDGIFELRCIQGSNITRTLYFFYTGKRLLSRTGSLRKQRKLRPQKSSWQRSGGPTGSDAMSMINDKRWFP